MPTKSEADELGGNPGPAGRAAYGRPEAGEGMEARAGFSLSDLRTFRSFQNPPFRLYYGAMLCQMASMNMQMIAKSLLVYRLTGSVALLGVMSLANAVPMLFLSLFGGVIADRVQKKYALLAAEVSSAVVVLGIALALTSGYLSAERAGSWWILIVASMLQGAIMGLMMPSRQAIIPELVGEGQLMNAVALNNLGMNIMRLTAPALVGFLIDALDFSAIFYGMTALYLMAGAFIFFLPPTGTMALRGGGALRDLKDGFQYVRRETTILILLLVTLVIVILSMPYMTLLPVFTEDILKVGATGMGMLVSVSGAGAMAGSLVLASLPNRKRGAILLVSSLILGLALVGFSFSSSWRLSLALIIFVGLGQTARMTLGNALLQHYVADEYRGRVMSFYMMDFGLSSFGVFLTSLLAEGVGIQWAIGGLALVLVAFSCWALVFVPRIRRLD